MLRDPDFGPTRIRAYGTYTVKVRDAGTFMTEIVGTDGEFTTDEVTDQIRNIIVQEFSRVIGSCGIPVLDMAGNTHDLGKVMAEAISGTHRNTGWSCRSFTSRISACPRRWRRCWTSAPRWALSAT